MMGEGGVHTGQVKECVQAEKTLTPSGQVCLWAARPLWFIRLSLTKYLSVYTENVGPKLGIVTHTQTQEDKTSKA